MNGKVKKLREQRALSLSDVAQITGLSRVTINRIENGKQKPMPRTIRKLANALGVNVEELTSEQASFINVPGNRQ
ncbi:MAG: helix-turn-helix domain-containing protein [Chloroflexi bacterium]|nr:helix-turn-helix domain-containing protein [Chloroflexota bacterium]